LSFFALERNIDEKDKIGQYGIHKETRYQKRFLAKESTVNDT